MVFVIYCHLMDCFSGAYLDPEPGSVVAVSTLKKLVIGRLGPWWPLGALVALGGVWCCWRGVESGPLIFICGWC